MNGVIQRDSTITRPIEAEAYDLALSEIDKLHPGTRTRDDILDIVMTAILDLRNAGQSNPEMLSRYAIGRALAVIRSTQH